MELWLKIKEESPGHNRIAYDLQPEVRNVVRFFEAVSYYFCRVDRAYELHPISLQTKSFSIDPTVAPLKFRAFLRTSLKKLKEQKFFLQI